MKSINIIIPYFGNFNNYFSLFLLSCKYNSTINWTIITDCKNEYSYPKNVQVVLTTFDEIKERIQKKFDFTISLDNVHKLCEFKPAYAYLFPEYIEGYDYWGYGDMDVIYGDIRRFLTDEILDYDKVFILGHLSLIKNTKVHNEMFMRKIDGEDLYREAFSNPENYNFDEEFMGKNNINTLFEQNDYRVFKDSYAADIFTKSSNFILDVGDGKCEDRKESFFLWNKGRLCRYYFVKNTICKEEFLYIHLQKRVMKNNVNSNEIIKIIPNRFEDLEVEVDEIENAFHNIKKKYPNIQYFRVRFKNLKTKIRRLIDKG